MSPSIYSASQGFFLGLISHHTKRLENSVKAGGSCYLTSIYQSMQSSIAVSFIDKTRQICALTPLSTTTRWALHLTPFVLSLLKTSSILPQKIKPLLNTVHNQLGSVYLTASIVSSIALLFFGQTTFAIFSLSTIAWGLLDRHGYIPLKLRQLIHPYEEPIADIANLVFGNVITRSHLIIDYFAWGVIELLNRYKSRLNTFSVQQQLTPSQVIDFFNRKLDAKINRSFIHYNPLPPIPSIDIEIFMEKFEEINWNRHLLALRKKLKQDPRFIQQHSSPELKTDDEIITFAKDALAFFIQSVKERRILEGEPADYEKLHNYLRLIAQHLIKQTDEIVQTDILLRLAIEGGGYCGSGKFHVVESLYAETTGTNPEVPFADKIFHCLQDERNLWMEQFYHFIFFKQKGQTFLGKITEAQDIHTFNSFVNLHGDDLGVRKASADNDATAFTPPILKIFSIFIQRSWINPFFWQTHPPSLHTELITNALGTPKLPKSEVYIFCSNWIERQSIDADQKNALKDELLENATLYGYPLEIDGRFDPDFITLMLVDLGIMELVPKKNTGCPRTRPPKKKRP